MRHGSLFSGIGGFDLAAQWMGWENVFQVEIDPFCQKVLEKNFPNVKRYGDIKEFDGTKYRGTVDILTGGFPCQPVSTAGLMLGKADPRWLWPEMYRIIDEIKPAIVVPENVNGIRKYIDEILSDLESIGYTVEPVNLTAGALGFDHIRNRYWFVAHSRSLGWEHLPNDLKALTEEKALTKRTWSPSSRRTQTADELDSLGNTFLRFEQEFGEPAILGVANGLPKRLDVSRRLHACGNAIVPQVAFEIFKAIEAVTFIA